jgi:hypothetical protein
MWLGGRWVPVPMAVGALLADFFYENEDVLYPPGPNVLGGRKYIRYVKHAAIHGWQKAEAGLRAERERKNAQFTLPFDEGDTA